MTPIQLNLYLFAATVIAFAWVGFSASRRSKSANEYFHHPSLAKNVLSLTATNLTLGTGLIYLIYGAQSNGLLMLLPVICVGVGYWLLAGFLDRANQVSLRTGKNYLAAIDYEISKATGEKSNFARIVTASLVFIFVLILAFEIFASSKVISPFLYAQPTVTSEIMLSIVIFIITVLYAVMGGVRAVFNVDYLQVPLVCLFLAAFIYLGVPDLGHPTMAATALGHTFKYNSSILTAVLIACINSIATQFYSILNWGAVSNVAVGEQKKLLRWVGTCTSAALAIFVLVGLLHAPGPTGQVWQSLVEGFSQIATHSSLFAFLVSGVLMLGLASILLTTTDAVVVNCIMFWFDNIAGGNSKDQVESPSTLSKIRWIGATTFSTCFAVLLILNYAQPDPFYLLLSMAGGVVVFAPMIVTAGYLTTRGHALRYFTRRVTLLFFVLFLASGLADVILLSKRSTLVPYIGLVSFVGSLCVCSSLLWRSTAQAIKNKGIPHL